MFVRPAPWPPVPGRNRVADAGDPSKGVSMKPKTDIRPVLKPGALYLGDNGRCSCTEHAGMTPLYTGRAAVSDRAAGLDPLPHGGVDREP